MAILESMGFLAEAEDVDPMRSMPANGEGSTLTTETNTAAEPPAEAVISQPGLNDEPAFEGFIEFFGRQDAAGCLIVGGWASRSWMEADCPAWVTVVFERGSASSGAKVVFYERADLGSRGLGFLLVLQNSRRRLGRIRYLELHGQETARIIAPTDSVSELSDRATLEFAESVIVACFCGSDIESIRSLLARRFLGEGYIDSYFYHPPSEGWFVSGWVSNDWLSNIDAGPGPEVIANLDSDSVSCSAAFSCYPRQDVHGRGLGVILHVAPVENAQGRLLSLTLRAGNAVVNIKPARVFETVLSNAIAGDLLHLIAHSDEGPGRDRLLELTSRVGYQGHDTIEKLPSRIFLEIDETVNCAPDSIILIGWLLAKPGIVSRVRLRSNELSFPVDFDKECVWLERNDVISSIGSQHGFSDPRCGFLLRLPIQELAPSEMYLEIETVNNDIAFKRITKPRLEGIDAIKRILESIQVEYDDVDRIYDHVLGPAIGALNTQRLRQPVKPVCLQMGERLSSPRYSVIVPLYGRIDFMEVQVALFATLGVSDGVELIYVLDDPRLTREAQRLAGSLYERFSIPFQLLCLGQNVGFAPANNIGLRASRGRFVCFMNSDVFPTNDCWLEQMAMHLEKDESLGVVGPLLLFEDDSVQHQGIFFKRLPQFGNWAFAQHRRKGLRAPTANELLRELAVTGACMMLRREDILRYGGFDEGFIIGDFEDTDLCFKLATDGFAAAVDTGVRMYHLERKSQASSANLWRTNLTLYNAWVHQRRWGYKIGVRV